MPVSLPGCIMCGISGWIFDSDERAEASAFQLAAYIKSSLSAMVRRGPDSEGSAQLSRGAMGARRLAIIDLKGGAQPIYNEDKSVVAVLNGEIYNFKEVRHTLEASGHRFSTRTDTEVLVHGYEHWGPHLPRYLQGMFAFAIWDERQKIFFAARDRLGKKPFFYTQLAGGVRFASELKALLSDGAIHPQVDYRSLLVFLTLQHLPPPLTPLEGIFQLRGGEALLFENGHIRTHRYWEPVEIAASKAASPSADPRPLEALERIGAAATARTIADVPIGIFLSGGIDSSLVAAMLHRAGYDLETFSVGFADTRFDETPKARAVSRHLGSTHTEMVVDPPSAENIAEIVWHLDEPLADSSVIPQYLIANAASARLKVVISGDGGDEFFGGYRKHHQFLRVRPILRLASPLPTEFMQALGKVQARFSGSASRMLPPALAASFRRARRAASLSKAKEVDAYLDFLSPVPSFERKMAAGDALISNVGADTIDASVSALIPELSHVPSGLGPLWRMGLVDALTELPGDILVKVDRMSMANSLEIRSPFLDHSIVEWAFSLSDAVRCRRGETKPLLRDAARMVLPPDVAKAPKQGFGVPLSEWMRREIGVKAAEVLLDPESIERGWIHRSYIETLFAQNLAGLDMGPRLWQVFVLELWARSYLDKSPPEPVEL